MFGASLKNIPKYSGPLDETVSNLPPQGSTLHKLPAFVVHCVSKIDPFNDSVGIYRVNGDMADVQKIRQDN